MRSNRIQGTRSVGVVPATGQPARFGHSAAVPDCPKCGDNKLVVRVWFGGRKQWACSEHFKITSTKTKQATLKQRLLHKLPEADTMTLSEVFPNRAARRRSARRR